MPCCNAATYVWATTSHSIYVNFCYLLLVELCFGTLLFLICFFWGFTALNGVVFQVVTSNQQNIKKKILFTCLELGNYAKLCFTNELHDILNLRTIRHLVNNLVDSIEYACISCHSLRGIHVVGTCAHLRHFCHLPYNVGIKYSAIARKGTDNQEDKGRFPPYNHFIHPMVYIAKKGLYTLLSRCIDPWNNREVWVDNYFFR